MDQIYGKKEDIRLSPITQTLPIENNLKKEQSDNTKTSPKTSITQ